METRSSTPGIGRLLPIAGQPQVGTTDADYAWGAMWPQDPSGQNDPVGGYLAYTSSAYGVDVSSALDDPYADATRTARGL